jgi:hypothetical protein
VVFAFPAVVDSNRRILAPSKATPHLLSANLEPESNAGDVDTRFIQAGGRMSLAVEFPPMPHRTAAAVVGALIRAESEEMSFPWPQPGFNIPPPGGPLNTASLISANARQMNVASAPAYVFGPSQAFNFVLGGRTYLHLATEGTTEASGPAFLRFGPSTRLEIPAGTVIEVAAPVIVGFVQNNGDTAWDVDNARHYGVSFTIKERK